MNRLLKIFVIAAIAIRANAAFSADPYPIKAVHLVTHFNPSQAGDPFLRVLAASLSEILAQPVIVENRPGGVSGLAAFQQVARARPDGYNLLPGYAEMTYLKQVHPGVDVDPMVDFVPIVKMVATSGLVLMVRNDSPAKTAEDLITRLKSNPGKFNYATGGIASSPHLAIATLLAVTGASALHIPHKGGGELVTLALLRGDVEFIMGNAGLALTQVKSGKLRALGIAGESRHRQLPEVPTLRELLKSDLLVQGSWGGLFAPAKTPDEVIKKLHAATLKALGSPTVQKAIDTAGITASPSRSPEEFAALVRRDYEKWGEIVKRSGVKAE